MFVSDDFKIVALPEVCPGCKQPFSKNSDKMLVCNTSYIKNPQEGEISCDVMYVNKKTAEVVMRPGWKPETSKE